MRALRILIKISNRINRRIIIYGPNLPIIKDHPENISFEGYVKNISDIYNGACALIYPISYGTGIKNKIIESMSYGIPVIGFSSAFTNLDVINGRTV